MSHIPLEKNPMNHNHAHKQNLPLKTLIPTQNASVGMLKAAIAILCFIATFILAILTALNQTTLQWNTQINQEITVLIKPMHGSDIEKNLQNAQTILDQTPGVTQTRIISFKETQKLLRPWIKNQNIIKEIPLSRLIKVTIDIDNPPDYQKLQQTLKDNIPESTLNTHQRWKTNLTNAAQKITQVGYAILSLILITMTALTVFAVRTVIEVNRNIVSVMHITGAKDNLIAKLFITRIARIILVAGALGTVTAIAILHLASLNQTMHAITQFISPLTTPANIIPLLTIPIIMMIIGLISAYLVILRILKNET